MAPINFEDNIREKMQERELQPSPDAWERLEARLGAENKSGLTRTTWFAVAASFIGILILASVFLNNDGLNSTKDGIVEEELAPVIEAIKGDAVENMIEAINQVEPVVNEAISSEEINPEKTKRSQNEQPAPEIAKIMNPVITENKEAVVEVKIDDPGQLKEQLEDPIIDRDTFIKNKVDEVVAEVQNKAKDNQSVTAEEIDELLVKAQRDIANQRILNSQSNKVDAAALLLDVEFEMERGFRDRVFDLLGDGYKKIRTAVAERNY